MKKYLLSLCVTMLSFVGAWAQSVTKTVSADGKTLTLSCEGTITEAYAGTFNGEGYKFNSSAEGVLFYDEVGTPVKNNDLCSKTKTYYTRTKQYKVQSVPTLTKYTIKVDNLYTLADGKYSTVAVNTEATGTYYEASASKVDDMSVNYTEKTLFGDTQWKIYLYSSTEWLNIGADVKQGEEYSGNPSDYMYVASGQKWNGGEIATSDVLASYLQTKNIIGEVANLYYLDGTTYVPASNTEYDVDKEYFTVTFTQVANIKDETYTASTVLIQPEDGVQYYIRTGSEGDYVYTAVYTGNEFDGTATYCVDDDYAYNGLTGDDLNSYVTSATVATNYWESIYAEIRANRYDNVILESDGGEKAVINSNVIRYLLWGNLTTADNNVPNTAIKKLDLGGVECSDLNDKSWMIVDGSNNIVGDYAVANFQIQELTLPLTKAANDDYVVPAGVLQYFAINTNTALKSIVIPNGYTEVAARAFAATKDGTFGDTGLPTIEEYTFPPSLKIIGEKAFYYNSALKHINIPNNSITQIWRFAFAGTILDSFDFPASLRFIGAGAFDNVQTLKVLDFSSTSLTYIGNSAFYSNTKIEVPSTLTFPPTIEYIGPGAFNFREYGDIYFTGEHKAPTCPVGPIVTGLGDEAKLGTFGNFDMAAWSGNTHMGYNGFVDDARKLGGDHASEGYANRENYQNHKVYFTMLHFPAGVTIEEAKTYKDVTRKYITERNADGSFSYGGSIPFGDEKSDKVTKFADHGATEWDSKSYGSVAPGYEDTYLGAQKIWPSQNQWMRAYTTVANGVEWNGKDEYRPDVDATMLKWMKYDNLQLWDPTTNKYVALNGEYAYTEDYVNEYNSKLDDAWNSTTVKTPATYYDIEDIIAHNADIEGTVKLGDPLYYTQAEIDAHNADWDGAKKAGIDILTPATPARYLTWEEYLELHPDAEGWGGWYAEQWYYSNLDAVKEGRGGSFPYNDYYVDAQPAIYYDAITAAAYNEANNPDAWHAPKQKGSVETWEQADIWNATIDGAWLTTTEKTPAEYYNAQEIKDHNNSLDDAIKWNEETNSYGGAPVETAFADYISKIAYQSTRRFVLADDGSRKGEDYPTDVKGHNWWTIVFPFSMTKAEVDEVFGVGTHVCLFSGVDRNAKNDAEVKHITLKFQNDVYAHSTPATAYKTNTTTGAHYAEFDKTAAAPGDDDLVIKAFESYMIYPMKGSQDAAEFKIKNPKIEQGSPWPTVIKANTEIHGNKVADWVDTSDDTEYRFVGNLTEALVNETGELETNKIPQYSYVYAKKKNDDHYQFWFYTGTASAWKVNKCVVQATERDGGALDNKNFFGGDPNGAKQVSLFGADTEEETTEIEDITIVVGEGENAAIYNISGQRIVAPQKGLYIKNGKKYIAK